MNPVVLIIILCITLIGCVILLKRRMRNKIVYIETSAVNFLAGISSTEDAIATRIYHAKKKNQYIISVVTLWEILMTSDEIKRETLIFYSQNALYKKLIFSPSELIINFINSGCKELEPKKSIYTTLQIGSVWEDICNDNRKTIIFSPEELNDRTRSIRTFFKRIDNAISDVKNESNSSELKQLADSAFEILSFTKSQNIDKDSEKVFKLSIIFIATILCAGIEFDNEPIENFWKEKTIDDTGDRLIYILTHYEDLVHTGPFVSMALMALNQIQEDKKPGRGLFWDALHSLYLPYVDILLTKDTHFKKLQAKVNHRNFSKIKVINDETFIKRKVNIKRP